ncbi:MAG: glycosyltransferase [Candidatus Acidiferrales bacterium]
MTAAPDRSLQPGAPLVGLFPELLGVGGVQESGRQTVRALRNICAQMHFAANFLSLNDNRGAHKFVTGDTSLAFRGFGRSKVQFVLTALACAGNKPRIVLAAHPNLAVPARWVKRLAPQAKVIVMTHGIDVWEPLTSSRRSALLAADLVLAPSTYTLQKLTEKQGVPAGKIRRLPWPLDSDVLGMAEATRNLPSPPEGFPRSPVILTVGRWSASERYKGADELIRAVAQLSAEFPALSLVAVGGGDDLLRLKQIAADLGRTNAVKFFDGLSRPELSACYAAADIFALPSTGEGFGFVFIEAMAFAKPVVGVSAGGVTDLVEDGVNGLLVPPADSPALVQALRLLLRDRTLRVTLGQQGLQIVRDQYRFEAFEERLKTILAECISPLASMGSLMDSGHPA